MAIHNNYKDISMFAIQQVTSIANEEGKIKAEVEIGNGDYLWMDDISEVEAFKKQLEEGHKKTIELLDKFLLQSDVHKAHCNVCKCKYGDYDCPIKVKLTEEENDAVNEMVWSGWKRVDAVNEVISNRE